MAARAPLLEDLRALVVRVVLRQLDALLAARRSERGDGGHGQREKEAAGHDGDQHTEQSAALMPLHPVEPGRFRAVMGHFATGVAIVTASAPHGPVGMTANAVCSLSLDPLLLLVCFDNGARTLPEVERAKRFGVNVLAAGQQALARRFASKEDTKFADVPHSVHDGIPVIDGTLAWVGCDLERLVPAGDHTIGIGAVHAAELGADGLEPLVWFRAGYTALG